jgi:hypothetical protein
MKIYSGILGWRSECACGRQAGVLPQLPLTPSEAKSGQFAIHLTLFKSLTFNPPVVVREGRF